MDILYKDNDLNQSINSTLEPGKEAQLTLYHTLVPIFGSIIVTLNFTVVASSGLILKRGHQPRSTYMLLGNVAAADLITGVAVIFGAVSPKEGRTENSCSIQIGLIVSSTLASILSVGLIATDRFLYILHGLNYQHWVYPNRVRLSVLIVWIIALLIGFLPAMGWRGNTEFGRFCWFILLAPGPLILLTTALGALPIILVIVLYSIILHQALRKVIQLKEATLQTINHIQIVPDPALSGLRLFRGTTVNITPKIDDDSTRNRFLRLFTKSQKNKRVEPLSKMKAIRVVMLTTGSFALTWMPYFIACAIYVNCDQDLSKQTEFCNNLSVAIASPLALLGFGNSFLNPFIYAWWHRGFRRALCKTSKNKSSRFTNRNLQYYRSTLDNNQTILTRIVSSKSRFTCSRTES